MAVTFINLDFEDPSDPAVLDGATQESHSSDGWTGANTGPGWIDHSFSASSVLYAPAVYYDTVERFGDPVGWTGVDETFVFAFADPVDPAELTLHTFDGASLSEDAEDFEELWFPLDGTNTDYATKVGSGHVENQTFYSSFPDASLAASFDVGTPETVEDFEEEWGPLDGTNTDYETKVGAGFVHNGTLYEDLGDVTTAAMSFDSAGTPEDVEDFEELWDGNESFITSWAGISSPLHHIFDGENEEDFEEVASYADQIYVLASPPAGDYTVFVNGREHVYTSPGSETQTQVRDGLLAVLSGTPEPVTTAAGASDRIDVTATKLPVTHILGVQAPSGKLSVSTTFKTSLWTQYATMATI